MNDGKTQVLSLQNLSTPANSDMLLASAKKRRGGKTINVSVICHWKITSVFSL